MLYHPLLQRSKATLKQHRNTDMTARHGPALLDLAAGPVQLVTCSFLSAYSFYKFLCNDNWIEQRHAFEA